MTTLFTPSSAPLGDFEASVYYSQFLGTQALQALTLRSGLTGKLPEGRDPQAGKQTTTAGMPIVQCWDLKQRKGDRVTIDMKGRFTDKPIMNDRDQLERKESLKYARDQVRLSLYTHTGDPGGIMTQQRNPHDTRMDAMDASIQWAVNLEDNLFMVHAAGARGDQESDAWVVPLESDPDFQEIIGNSDGNDDGISDGNPLLPPTRSRYALPGDATGLDDLASTDTIDLNFLTRIRGLINTSKVPLQPISSAELNGMGGSYNGNANLLIGLISEEQWITLKQEAGDTSFSRMVVDANTRIDFNKHPAFADLERFMWAGILWFKCPRAIQFSAGMEAQQYDPTTQALETIAVNVRAHRGMVLGAQALACAYGDASGVPGGTGNRQGGGITPSMKSPYSWREDVRQGGSTCDLFIRLMGGYKKLRYNWKGVPYDNGVFTFDTYQPGL